MKIYLVTVLAATFLLIACEQKESPSNELAELPAADISDRADQDTDLHTENHPGGDSDSIGDMRELRASEKAADAADRRTYERTEEMAEEISDKIEEDLE